MKISLPPGWRISLLISAGMLVPAVGIVLGTLLIPPADVRPSDGIVSTRVTDRHGETLREIRSDGRGIPISSEQISPAAVDALIATEDRFFYSHPGINPLALLRTVRDNLKSGRVVSGGSTITMQVARALRGRSGRGLTDKVAELHLALRLEVHLSKSEILELWLNRVPFGNQTHGIESAARLYFGKTARDLNLAEAAYLIGLPQSPSRYDPFRHPQRANARFLRVLDAMERHGGLDPGERQSLEAMQLTLLRPQSLFRAPHFVEWVYGGLSDPSETSEVRTTIDLGLQTAVEELMRSHVRNLARHDVSNMAAVVLDNETGEILAYAGSADFWNDAASGQVDGVRMLRQPGSALKPFTYAHAFETRRFNASSVLADIEMHVPEAGGAFSPQNYDRRYRGPVSAREALAGSYNVPAIRLAREIGPNRLLESFRSAGLTSLTREAEHYGVGITLGNGEVRLLELARAYSGLARGGSLPNLRSINRIRTVSGETIHPSAGKQEGNGIEPAAIYLVTHILQDPEARAPAFGRGGPLELPFPAAVKTGTTKDYRDNWAVGYTPRHTVAVWAGNFDGRPMRWVSGVSGAAPLMKAIFLHLGPGGEFVKPTGIEESVVCPLSGGIPNAHCPLRRTEWFLTGNAPADVCDVHRLVRIDQRTGLLTDSETPAADVREEMYAVLPAEFHPWMASEGMPLPPLFSAAELAARREAASDTLVYSDLLTVQYPESGMTYAIDPVLRPEHQQIHLRGVVSAPLYDVQWWVNGTRLSDRLSDAKLPLRRGRHEIELRAVNGIGEQLRSRPVVVRVE